MEKPIRIHVIWEAIKNHHILNIYQTTFQYHPIHQFLCTHRMNLSQLNPKRHHQHINRIIHNHRTLSKHSPIPIPSLSSTNTNDSNISNVKFSDQNTNHMHHNYHKYMYMKLILLLQIRTIQSQHHTSHHHLYKLQYPHSRFKILLQTI